MCLVLFLGSGAFKVGSRESLLGRWYVRVLVDVVCCFPVVELGLLFPYMGYSMVCVCACACAMPYNLLATI